MSRGTFEKTLFRLDDEGLKKSNNDKLLAVRYQINIFSIHGNGYISVRVEEMCNQCFSGATDTVQKSMLLSGATDNVQKSMLLSGATNNVQKSMLLSGATDNMAILLLT